MHGASVTFSHSIRDKVLFIQKEIRGMYTENILVEELNRFNPELLSSMVDTTVGKISAMF